MTKAVAAQCVGGVVTVENSPVTATILSKGVGSSSGVAIIEDEAVSYVANNHLDLVALITSVNSMITKLTTILTAIDGATNSPGANAAGIALVVVENTTFLATKDLLR